MARKEKEPLCTRIAQQVLGERRANIKNISEFAREGLSTILIPGYTFRRAQRNIGLPTEDRAGVGFNLLNEYIKASFWGTMAYEVAQNYIF